MTEKPAVDTPEETTRSKAEETNIYFSDDDEDMNVDFDMDIDIDDDEVRNEENDGGSYGSSTKHVITDGKDSTAEDKEESRLNEKGSDGEFEEMMDDVEDEYSDREDEQQNYLMDVEHSGSTSNTEKKNNLSTAPTGMKSFTILIPKLDINKVRTTVQVSQFLSLTNKSLVKDQNIHNVKKQPEGPSTPTEVTHKPSSEKEVHMNCSHCKKSMMKGQTAYQKKGFQDVFCSKNCLFEMFLHNKAAARTCHCCQRAISQPLDVIMAAVDNKGTMKDFCSPDCLWDFRCRPVSPQTPPSFCSMCNNPCTITCELTLNETVQRFCSDTCLEGFQKYNRLICENCSRTCDDKPLLLKLEPEIKALCTKTCLDELTKNIGTSHPCAMCRSPQTVSDMITYKRSENVVELFCCRPCVSSYKLQPPTLLDHQVMKSSLKSKRKKDKQSNTEDADVGSSLLCHNEYHPDTNVVTKKCYNCFQEISRPQNMILAPVDNSGTMKELCSSTCLASVKSRRDATARPPPREGPRSECRMCARYSYCKFNLKLDNIIYKLCSDTCVINYHKINNIPLTYCDVCGSFCLDPRNTRKMDGGRRSMCSSKCVAKFKEKAETKQLCLMCQTSHLVLDMIENTNSEGELELFCSNRCMMVHNAQTFIVAEKRSPSPEEINIKEVKPPLLNLECIKEEPIDQGYCQILPRSVSNQDIKTEPNVAKEDLKIGSVFSLTGDSKPTKPTLAHMDLQASCSSCKNILVDGETVYQRKGHQEIFCSSSCLLRFFQMKSVKKTCHFCLQVITQHQDVLQASVDNEGTQKDFCSQTCLLSFNYKSSVSSKIPVVPIASHSQCSMCSRYCISKKEIIQQGVVHKICSEPCFLRFCNMNKLSVCVNCRSCSSSPLMLKMQDGNKTLCGAECLVQFKQKIQTPQPCAMCHISNPISNMVENRNRDNVVEFFCSCSCVMASKIQAVSASGASLNCDHCGKTSVPACHLVMSDSSIKNFCTLTCAMAFKESEKDLAASTDPAGASKPPKKLLCAQCGHTIKTTPKVIQRKDKMNFVCSLACSQEFKKANNITGTCEYCKNVRIIKDTKRVEDKECNFCSDSCRVLLHHDLESKPGQRYCSCAYCLSIAVTVVTKHNEGTEVEFCSKECSKNYKNLQNNVAKCDACGCKGKLKQSLPMVGEVKHFCDLKCLLHFCSNKVHMVDTASPASGSVVTTQSSPVIANVVSLASALSLRNNASTNSAQNVSIADIQTKVVGHASVQTVPKELKNKSMLCTPLVHNKGTSCIVETAETEVQTDKVDPEVVVLRVPVPVPVPVYVPVPMNMYTQHTPQPVSLPLPLPVPVFVPAMSDGSKKTTAEETKQLKSTDGDLNLRPETETEQTERNEKEGDQKDRDETKEGERQQNQSDDDDDGDADDYPTTFDDQDDLQSGANPNPISPSASPSQQTPGKVQNKSKKSKNSKEETPQSEAPTVTTKKRHKVNTRHGVEAWKRWIQWRESQTDLGPVSSHSVRLRTDILRCSAVDLSGGLYRFIKEVKQPDGEPYSPDGLFYLCLSIQKHLLENGRGENIFTDAIYNKFSTKITKLLKHFQPSVASDGSIDSPVKEEFLWDCKQVGSFSPMVLLNTMLFFCCKYFGFTTVKEHRQLSFAQINSCTRTNPDKTTTAVLRFYPPTEAESDADGVPAKKRKKDVSFLEMEGNTENPLRCPVRLYEFYLSKIPDSMRQRSNLFYLQPKNCCYPSSRLWFTSSPLQDSVMEAMIVRIFAVQELRRPK
uniref:Uncharacterized LOC110963615 n=2 Tax=Acanthochromis polyacanthus TaxID=80966 RepID=A0A3Q1FWC0_9TELE